MPRHLDTPRCSIKQITERSRKISSGTLAEDYDGIGQYTLVSLAGSSVSSAYKARLCVGDFGTGQVIPRGTRVTLFVNRGQIEILSLGAK